MSRGTLSNEQNITVFIAEDSLIIRERLVAMLDELGGIKLVGQAASAPEAISAIGQLKPEVVILDIRMPGGSGLDVLRAIAQGEPAPLIIILTNYPYRAYRKKCLAAGADFFFDKSTEFEQIPAVFEQLRQRGTERRS